ncbi:FliH/SctL family protein [Neobacillus niacini]|uniref:FliH/SctL family protein n=1 Tax=Neobacillus niacini TaxID=86668 RepID=UPI0030031A73
MSYSKVFKASQVSIISDVKVIKQPLIQFHMVDEEGSQSSPQTIEEVIAPEDAKLLILEANKEAQSIIEAATNKARSLEIEAEEKMNLWWEENQKKFETMSLEAKQHGYQEGYELGKQEAEQQIQEQYHGQMEQIQNLLHQAFQQKEEIIAEAEPFLLEVSTVIASQIIKQELEDSPEKFVELIKQHILRVKEKESITVCVNPDDYDFIQGQRSHLVAMVNGETEIKIIPEHSISPKGCIIRTAFGSVDARIDTQIEEIKRVILEARRVNDSGVVS